jgi:hypothetical protein
MNAAAIPLSGVLLAALSGSPSPDGPQHFAGTYKGSLLSANGDTPSTTTLAAAGGLLTGQYSFVDTDGSTATGTLDACRVQARLVTCRWRDNYGTGLLRMSFDADYCEFKGEWATSIVAQAWAYWNGSKGCAPVAGGDERERLQPPAPTVPRRDPA